MDSPDPQEPLALWLQEPSPQNLAGVVNTLDPIIKSTLTQIGGAGDPYLYSQGRVLAAKAVETYDPSYGASLPTWVNRQLMPLRRARRERQTSVRVPESVQLDAYQMMSAEREFMDTHDREPDLEELSELTKLPVKRIAKVRQAFIRTMTDAATDPDMGTEDKGVQGAAHSFPDHDKEALDYAYHEADYVDRKILEHKLGYGGALPLNGVELARLTKVSPAQITRRAAKLTMRLNEYRKILEEQG